LIENDKVIGFEDYKEKSREKYSKKIPNTGTLTYL